MTEQTQSKTEFESLPKFYDRWAKSIAIAEGQLCSEKSMLRKHSNLIKLFSIRPDDKNKRDNLLKSYNEFEKYIHSITGVLLPGNLEKQNTYFLLSRIQKETQIDLGVCEFLDTKIRENLRKICMRTYDVDLTPQCLANSRRYRSGTYLCEVKMYVSGVENCIFNEREKCPVRINHLANSRIFLANSGGVMIGRGRSDKSFLNVVLPT